MQRRHHLMALGAGLAALALPHATLAQDAAWPTRTVRIVAPVAPGGGVDLVARTMADRLGRLYGQTFIVDNQSGAGGTIASQFVTRAAPDGYTLMLAISAILTNPAVNPRVTYHPVRDFTPLMLVARSPYRVVIYPGLPAHTMQEWVALAKAKPGAMNYGSAGSGTAVHLAAELFRMQAGITMTHVPYKGSGPALTDLVAGQIQMMFVGTLSAAPLVKAGRVRALAVTSLKRRADAPDLPTLAETAAPGYDAFEWFSVFGPARLPKPIVDRLYGELVKAVNEPDLKERLITSGMDFVGGTSAELAETVKRDFAKWTRVVKETGLKAD